MISGFKLMRPCPHCDGRGAYLSGGTCLDCVGKREVHNLCGEPLVEGGCECPADDDKTTPRDRPVNPKGPRREDL